MLAGLADKVLAFTSRARRSPADAVNPAYLEALERAAKESFAGAFVALHAPMAPETWEIRTALPGSSPTSDRVPLDFPRAVEIVGMYPSIVSTGGSGIAATLNDVDVQIELDAEHRITTSKGLSGTPQNGTGSGNSFVTLAAMGIQTPRLHALRLEAARPQLAATFAWKRGANVYQDAIIALAIFGRWIG